MADSKLTGLTELSAEPAEDDWLYIVDKSDTTDDAAGSSRKIEVNRIGGVNSYPHQWYSPDGDQTDGYSIPGATAADGTLQTVATTTADDVHAMPFLVTRPITITGACILVGTAQASTNVRIGIYNANQTTAEMTTLVSDIGTLSTASAVQVKTGALSIALAPGLYWSAVVSDTTTGPNLRGPRILLPGFWPMDPSSPSPASPWKTGFQSNQSGASSALPADATAWTWTSIGGSSVGITSAVFYKWTVG